jgi:hypothetical protein
VESSREILGLGRGWILMGEDGKDGKDGNDGEDGEDGCKMILIFDTK